MTNDRVSLGDGAIYEGDDSVRLGWGHGGCGWGTHGEISENDFVLAFHGPRDRVDEGPTGIIEYHLLLCSLFLHTH